LQLESRYLGHISTEFGLKPTGEVTTRLWLYGQWCIVTRLRLHTSTICRSYSRGYHQSMSMVEGSLGSIRAKHSLRTWKWFECAMGTKTVISLCHRSLWKRVVRCQNAFVNMWTSIFERGFDKGILNVYNASIFRHPRSSPRLDDATIVHVKVYAQACSYWVAKRRSQFHK
jgi:hypothetical protein